METQPDQANPDESICVRVVDSDGRTVSEFRTQDERAAIYEFVATTKTGFGELYGVGSHVAILDPNLRVGASYVYEGRQCYQWRFDKKLGAQLAASANDPALTDGSYKTTLQLMQEAEAVARASYLQALLEGDANPQERASESAHGVLSELGRLDVSAIPGAAGRIASRVDGQVIAEKMILDWFEKDVGTLLRAMTSSELRKAEEVLNSMTPVDDGNAFWLGRSVPENADRFESKIDAAKDFVEEVLDEMSMHRMCRTHVQEAGFLCYEYLADRSTQPESAADVDQGFAKELGDWMLRRQQVQLPIHSLVNDAVAGLSVPGAAYRGFSSVVELANLYGQVPAHLDPRFAKTLSKPADDLLLVQFDDREEFLHGSLLYVDVQSGAEFRVPYIPENYNTAMAADLLQQQMRSVQSLARWSDADGTLTKSFFPGLSEDFARLSVQKSNPDKAQRDDAIRAMEDRLVKLLDGVKRAGKALSEADVNVAKSLRSSLASFRTPRAPEVGEGATEKFVDLARDTYGIAIPQRWDGTAVACKDRNGVDFRVELGVGGSETVVVLDGVPAAQAHELVTRLNVVSVFAKFLPRYEAIQKRDPLVEVAVGTQGAAP